MKSRAILCAVLLLAATFAGAQDLTINHDQVGCIVAGQYAKLQACFAPGDALKVARVYFRAQGTPTFYYVDMKPGPKPTATAAGENPPAGLACMDGILPKAQKTITAVDYYIEGMNRAGGSARSADYAPVVVDSAEECKKKFPAAPVVSKATVVVGGGQGLPAGFAAASIGAAAGGSSILLPVLVVGGGAAVAGAAIVATNDSNNTETTTLPGSASSSTTAPSTTAPSTTSPPPTSPDTTPSGENRPPNLVLDANPPRGREPLEVTFNLCRSSDPDGDRLRFTIFFGDGASDGGGACRYVHTYPEGTYSVHACVTDNFPGHEVCGDTEVAANPIPPPTTVPPTTVPPTTVPPTTVPPTTVPPTTVPPTTVPPTTLNPCAGDTVPPSVNWTTPNPVASPPDTLAPGQTVTATATDASGVQTVQFNVTTGGSCTDPGSVSAPSPGAGSSWNGTWTAPASCGFCTITFHAQATDICGNTSGFVTADANYFPFCPGPQGTSVSTVLWTSELQAGRAQGQVVFDGAHASAVTRGRTGGIEKLARGEHRIEGELLESDGAAAWRFTLSGQSIVPGSLRVLSGQVVSVSGNDVVFRMEGRAGERVTFTVRTQ